MTIFQAECFLAVAEHLNFAKAAEQMHISQPAITRQIQTLETELNVKLFYRSTRSVKLTAEGRLFLTDAQTIVSASKRAVRRFAQKKPDSILDFHIGCSSVFHMERLVGVLEKLASIYPNLHPRLHLLPGSQLLESVDNESLQVVLSYRSQKEKSSLTFKELLKVPYVCVCRKDSPLAKLASISADDLRPYPMVVYDPGAMMIPEAIAGQWEWAKDKEASKLYFCESSETLMLLVGTGLGVTVVPELHVPKDRGLHICPLKKTKLIPFGLYYKSIQSQPCLKDFIRLIKEEF